MALFSRLRSEGADGTGAGDGATSEAPPARSRAIGVLLREARQGFGRDLNQIGAVLRIRPPYLQAIEEGHYDELPGPTYAIGFIKTYAEYLGLDGNEMARRFKQETEGLELKRDLSFPMPLTERSVPGGTILLLALILAICGYGIWYYLSSSERGRPERVGAVPSTLLAPDAVPTMGAAPNLEPAHPTEAAASSAILVPPSPMPPPAPGGLPAPPPRPPPALAAVPSPTAAPPALVAPAPAPSPPPAQPPAVANLSAPQAGDALTTDPAHIFGATTGPARIVIHATGDSWVQVRDGEHKEVFQRVMRAGEIFRVPDKPGLVLWLGNAGGVEVLVDGHPVPSLGGVGVVRRGVLLDPQKLRAGAAVTE